jgi:hypothetical protein
MDNRRIRLFLPGAGNPGADNMKAGSRVLLVAAAFISLLPAFNASAQLPNAWQINDASSNANTTLSYTTNLNVSQQMVATNLTGGFRFTVFARIVDNFGNATETMQMSYVLGSRHFLIWWGLDGSSNLTARLEGGSTYTLHLDQQRDRRRALSHTRNPLQPLQRDRQLRVRQPGQDQQLALQRRGRPRRTHLVGRGQFLRPGADEL